MATECDITPEIARKNERMILQRLASVGQTTVADAMGVSESTVCRMKDKDEKGAPSQIQKWSSGLAAMGLKTVPAEYKCYDPQKIEAIFRLAKAYMAEMESTRELVWEE